MTPIYTPQPSGSSDRGYKEMTLTELMKLIESEASRSVKASEQFQKTLDSFGFITEKNF